MWRNFLRGTSESVASYEEFQRKYFQAAASKEAADAAHEKFKIAVEQLATHKVLSHEVQKMRAKLEDSAGKKQRREQEHQALRIELVRLWNVNAYLLAGAVSFLDDLKGQK